MGPIIVSEFFLQGKQTAPVTVKYCRTKLIVRLPRNLTTFRKSSSFTWGLSWLLRGSVQQNSLPDQMPGATTDQAPREAGGISSPFQMFCICSCELQMGRELGKAIVGLYHYSCHNTPSLRAFYTCAICWGWSCFLRSCGAFDILQLALEKQRLEGISTEGLNFWGISTWDLT